MSEKKYPQKMEDLSQAELVPGSWKDFVAP